MIFSVAVQRYIAGACLLILLCACGSQNKGAPVAQAGTDQTVSLGQSVQLDASASSDPEGDPLSFSWTLESRPEGSSAELQDAASAEASFTPDATGEFSVELTVSDGKSEASDGLIVTVTATGNRQPEARAGDDQTVEPGDSVELDARASSDADGDPLSFSWRFISVPEDSAAALNDTESRTPRFTADKPGEYQLGLSVSDGLASVTDTVTVRANRPPQADAGPNQTVPLDQEVILNGAGSDPDGDALSYSWSVVSRPAGSVVPLADADAATTSFIPDAEGSYTLELSVSDGAASASDRLSVTITAASGVTSSIIYASPAGDDGFPGTQTKPVRTLSKALDLAAASPDISRVSLGAGSYTLGATFEVGSDVDIVGPEDEANVALIEGTTDDDLLDITDEAFVTLLRVRLETPGVAVRVANRAGVSLVDVVCEARGCISSGEFLGASGGSVSVTRSTLQARSSDEGSGIFASTGEVTVNDTLIEGFSRGIETFDSPLTVKDSVVRNTVEGTWLFGGDFVRIESSTLDANGIGLSVLAAKNVSVVGTEITNSEEIGVQLELQGVALLDGVTISSGEAEGVVIARDFPSTGEVLTMRNSTITGHLSHGIAVYGEQSFLDLGTSTEEASNEISFNKGRSLYDERPADARGLITLNGTVLESAALRQPAAGTYSGPGFSEYGIEIVNQNDVTVYR